MSHIVEVEHLSKSYHGKRVLHDISLGIEEGSMIAIVGASGAGKTTLLNIMGLLEPYSRGSLKIDGREYKSIGTRKRTKALRQTYSFLFQNFALAENDTVDQNLNIALKYVKGSEKKAMKEEALKEVGLEGYLDRKIYHLSSAERQKVAVARAFLKPSKIILADEPTGSLDEESRVIVMEHLKELNRRGKTIVIVTHDPFVSSYCDKIFKLKRS